MNPSVDQDFDITALMEVCACWPDRKVPLHVASDPLLERARQVLHNLSELNNRSTSSDLIPLIRHVLLRAAGDEGVVPWLRVPTIAGWPSAEQWEHAQFDILPGVSNLSLQPHWPRLSFLETQADLFDDAFRGVMSRQQYEVRADPMLSETMGLPTYTGQGQREALRALMHLPDGDVLIANLPTGSGKSLLAQLPPLVEQEGLMTLAIVPTVALAIDQATRMKNLLHKRYPHRELPPLAFHGGLPKEQRTQIHRSIWQGEQPILFTSPEYAVGSLRESLEHAAAQRRLNRVFIDEAHLVIGWGNGFRPAFQLLPALVRMLRSKARSHDIRVVLASATLTASTIHDLRRLFGPPERVHVVSAVHLRPEIRYAPVPCLEKERLMRVFEAVQLAPRPFILYVTRPDEADTWLNYLRETGLKRIDKFTGVTSSADRERLLRQWSANELDGMVATSAFGLGVDKSDVRTVIHATLPESLDRYYQEVGRSGRDGRAGAAIMLHTESDEKQARGIASPSLIGDENAYERWIGMIDSGQSHAKLPEVFWVDLKRLPSHLHVPSEKSQAWSVRTLTLMARAGLIEIVAMGSSQSTNEDTPLNINEASRAAVRILDDSHRNADHFAKALARAREDVHTVGDLGFKAISKVAYHRLEISKALQQMYSVKGAIWVPVSPCCGGCPTHWGNRHQTVFYHAPTAPRLADFASRSLTEIDRLLLPRAASNLLVISVPPDERFAEICAHLLATLAPILDFHTIAWDEAFDRAHAKHVIQAIPRQQRLKIFFDTLDLASLPQMVAGVNEVRALIWSCPSVTVLWDLLQLSRAQLEILLVPRDLAHPHHPSRKMLDTTPHIKVIDLLQLLSQ
ncbi:ATP-dependent DNA helicase RecQ [Candidatus Kaiserbacteria bacterium]|nr:ATP-dependent DNA helicase RecQ [Candidatus Kaiserbacteria bacterium]